MRFRILSHAGLEIEHAGVSLVCDPWLVGSCYWRAWWNYPPVEKELVDSVRPDYVYLTHVHWDHFQSASLARVASKARFVIPLEPSGRMKRDLESLGYHDIVELAHGQSLSLADDFEITSYHIHPYLDSGLVVSGGGVTLFNANDAKFMGPALADIARRHPKIDFVFRSHSSANSRIVTTVIDEPDAVVDKRENYTRDFALFARSVGARNAVPFASNHCYLHRDVVHLNSYAVSPLEVEKYFAEKGIDDPHLQVMVPGDSWSAEAGFEISEHDYFTNRERHIEDYIEQKRSVLEKVYEREDNARIGERNMHLYFDQAFANTPWLLRRAFKDTPVLFVLTAGERETLFEVDLYARRIRELDHYDDDSHPLQAHIPVAVMRHCVASRLFAHLGASKRVRYRVRSDRKRQLSLLNHLFQAWEYEILPLHRNLNWRFVSAWARRWRELWLYALIARDAALGRGFDMARHLPPSPERFPNDTLRIAEGT